MNILNSERKEILLLLHKANLEADLKRKIEADQGLKRTKRKRRKSQKKIEKSQKRVKKDIQDRKVEVLLQETRILKKEER